MAVVFTENKKIPPQVRAMGHYRGFGADPYSMNDASAVADVFRSLTAGAVDFFGGTTSEAKIAQANAAAMNAQLVGQGAADAESTKRTLIMAGAGLAGVVLLFVLLSGRNKVKVKVGGYRRRKKRSRR